MRSFLQLHCRRVLAPDLVVTCHLPLSASDVLTLETQRTEGASRVRHGLCRDDHLGRGDALTSAKSAVQVHSQPVERVAVPRTRWCTRTSGRSWRTPWVTGSVGQHAV